MNSSSTPQIFFEDIEVDGELWSATITLTADDICAFAQQWDPMPAHTGDDPGSLTASGTHLLAIKNRLLHDFPMAQTVIASFGFDEVRFREPGRPGDVLRLRLRWLEKRTSQSKPGFGIARHQCELVRADGAVLLSLFDTILISRRTAAD